MTAFHTLAYSTHRTQESAVAHVQALEALGLGAKAYPLERGSWRVELSPLPQDAANSVQSGPYTNLVTT